ncbi:hypothetical protein CRG98_023948 [Punica granatum]|uniref:Uncharacterized protein n=1 Tax=Punica granatum TaxID=22663 RepID=A0A2I0JHB0_PUNGR|nr:hypothetical protein CRG98_023948 [Punica granatum]
MSLGQKGTPFSFFNRSDQDKWLVRFVLLSTQFSIFVRDHVGRKERNPNHANKSRIYLVRKVEGLLCKIKKIAGRIGSNRIGLAGPKEKPPGREARPDWSSLGLNGPSPQRKRNGPRPVSRRAAGIGGSGGDEAGGGSSRPWTPRRQPEWTREIALGAADASPWSIRTSLALNQSESGEFSRFSGDGSRNQSIS